MHPLISERRRELDQLCARFRVRKLAVFGSAARPDSGSEPRDFDLLVEFQTMTPVEHADSYFGLLEELEKLLRAPVDLVEPGAIRNPIFQRAVEATQVSLYAAA
ncbi:MAG: nucleotidyltransferase domain-containing protein [Bryobacteraceae bacterium]